MNNLLKIKSKFFFLFFFINFSFSLQSDLDKLLNSLTDIETKLNAPVPLTQVEKDKLKKQRDELIELFKKEAENKNKLSKELITAVARYNNLFYKIIFDWILKTIIVAITQRVVELSASFFLGEFEGKIMTIKEEYNTKKSLLGLQVTEESQLILTEEQRNAYNSWISQLEEIDKNPASLITIRPLILLGGTGGTGKTSLAFALQKFVLKKYGEKKPSIISSLFKKLPFFLRGALNEHEDKNISIITISGAYFYKQSDYDKAANLFNGLLLTLEEFIKDNPNRKVILVVEEGESIANIPQFVTVLKEKTSSFEKMHQATKKIKKKKETKELRKHGVILILMTTNHMNSINEFFSRRALSLSFNHPTESQKIFLFTKYLDSILGKDSYTPAIMNQGVNLVRLCNKFSPSDIENLLSILSFNKNNLKETVTLIDFLKGILSTLTKMAAIVYKQQTEKEETLTRREVLLGEELIKKAEDFYEKSFEELYNPSIEEEINNKIKTSQTNQTNQTNNKETNPAE